jgi:hypothetical protein
MAIGSCQIKYLLFETLSEQMWRNGHVQLFQSKEQPLYVKRKQGYLAGNDLQGFKTAIPIPKGSVVDIYQRFAGR